MDMIETVQDNNTIIAIIVSASFRSEGIHFFTPPEFGLQMGLMNRTKGYSISPHIHRPTIRSFKGTQEVLFIQSGKVKIDLYKEDQSFLKSVIVKTGDFVLLASGGHGFKMLEDSVMIEVKQGPYVDVSADKICFTTSPTDT